MFVVVARGQNYSRPAEGIADDDRRVCRGVPGVPTRPPYGWTNEKPIHPLQITRIAALMRCNRSQALLLRDRKRFCYVGKCCQVLINVGLCMLNGNRPLLVPPIRLAHYSTIHHGK